ncbi:MAG: ATP synthase subunit I [Pseudomonadota bacterium]
MKGSRVPALPYLVVLLQATTALIVAAAFAWVDKSEAIASLLAGGVVVLPAAYFAWRARWERSPGRLLGQGLMKFVLTVTLMALVFAVCEPAPLGFFSAFVAMQLMYVVGPAARGGGPE